MSRLLRSKSEYRETQKQPSTPPTSFVDRVNRIFNSKSKSSLKKTETNLQLNISQKMNTSTLK